jgi:hypothetical protein
MVIEVLKPIEDRDKPFIDKDGTECKRIISQFHGWKKNKEVFEADAAYVRACHPKYVRYNDGHREKFDPTRHC